jgi:hypothetical protein
MRLAVGADNLISGESVSRRDVSSEIRLTVETILRIAECTLQRDAVYCGSEVESQVLSLAQA